MDASHLMERAENALRTGQTENLFPLYARRTLEKIAEEKAANRREWEQLGPEAAATVQALRVREAFQAVSVIVTAAWESLIAAIQPAAEYLAGVIQATHQDFALAPGLLVQETPAARERRMRTAQHQMRTGFQTARQITTPIRIRSNLS